MSYLEQEYRQMFRNLMFPERMKNMDVEKWVAYCKGCGATSVFLDAKSQAYVYYDSAILQKDPILGERDLVAEFKAAAERNGLKWGVYIAPREIDSMTSKGAEWQQRKADGSTVAPHGWWRTDFCWNAPGFRNLFSQMLTEISGKYHPHGFYIDGILLMHNACHCEACKSACRAETGREMPLKPDWSDPAWFQYIRWRNKTTTEAAKMIHEAVHGVDPMITVVFNNPSPWCGWYAAQSAAQAKWLDLVGTEIDMQAGVSYPGFQTLAENMAWLIGANRMLKGGKSTHIYTYFTPKTRFAEAVTWNDIALAAGALPCVQEHCNHMKQIFARTKECEPYLTGMKSAADVAVYVSAMSRDAYYRPDESGAGSKRDGDFFNDKGFFEEMRGTLMGLLHAHLPTELIHLEDGLEESDLSGFRLIILPNDACIPQRASERLQDYVRAGGTLLATMETGLRDPDGARTGNEILWPGSGIRFEGEIHTAKAWMTKYDAYGDVMEIEDDIPSVPDQFLVFNGGTAPWLGEDVMLGDRGDGVEVQEGLQFHDVPSCQLPTPAIQVSLDRNWSSKVNLRFRRSKEKGWEECPAIAARSFGKGCVCYLNFQVGSLIFNTGHVWWRNLLAHAVEVAAGEGPVAVDAPACVKVFAWHQPEKGRYILHLVNELSSVGVNGRQRVDHIPVTAKVKISWPRVEHVELVAGKAICKISRTEPSKWNIEIESLEDKAILSCEVG